MQYILELPTHSLSHRQPPYRGNTFTTELRTCADPYFAFMMWRTHGTMNPSFTLYIYYPAPHMFTFTVCCQYVDTGSSRYRRSWNRRDAQPVPRLIYHDNNIQYTWIITLQKSKLGSKTLQRTVDLINHGTKQPSFERFWFFKYWRHFCLYGIRKFINATAKVTGPYNE
jgi:hypothetical protein